MPRQEKGYLSFNNFVIYREVCCGYRQEHRYQRRHTELSGGAAQRQLHPPQDPAQQGGPPRLPHDGGEGPGLHLRDGRRPGQADQRDQGGKS